MTISSKDSKLKKSVSDGSKTVRRYRSDLHRPARVQITTPGVSATKQSFKDECDINNIMESFTATGVLNHANSAQPNYGYASSETFTESMHLIRDAEQMFSEQPSTLRARFENSAVKFLEFTENPDNLPEMVELGLMADGYELPETAAPPASSETKTETPLPPAS